MRDGIAVAQRGIPAVSLVTSDFWAQGDFMASSVGMPDLPRVKLPHPIAGTGAENINQIAHDIVSEVLDALERC